MKKITLSILLLFGSFAHANEEDKSLHYGTHLLTGTCSHIAVLASGVLGIMIGDAAYRANVPSWLHRTLKIKPDLRDGFLTEDRRLLGITLMIPTLLCFISGVWVQYKTPQWTDTYILGKSDKRTTKQNIVTFLNRFFIWYPIGILSGEHWNNQCRPIASENSVENSTPANIEPKMIPTN